MAAYPGFAWGTKETDNSILWDPGVFEMVSGSKFTITFVDRPRPQPIVRLRHLATGRELYVVNTHPSPGDGRYLTQRRNAQATLVSVVNNLRSTGLPVLVTGDMNDRGEFYCRVVPRPGWSPPTGAATARAASRRPSRCRSTGSWARGVVLVRLLARHLPDRAHTSDHFFISAMAHLL